MCMWAKIICMRYRMLVKNRLYTTDRVGQYSILKISTSTNKVSIQGTIEHKLEIDNKLKKKEITERSNKLF